MLEARTQTHREKQMQNNRLPLMPSARPTQDVMTRESYNCPELMPLNVRPRSMDAHNLPSLINGRRVWRDGRVEEAKA